MAWFGKRSEEREIQGSDPFLMGRTEAAERYGYLSRNAAQWRRISLLLLVCCVACVFAVIHTANRITVVPYVVQVDRHGYQIAVEPVAPSDVDSRLIVSNVGRYIWSLKTVFADPEAQLHLLNFVYHCTPENTPADAKFRDYYRKNNVEEIRRQHTVNVDVNSVLPLSPRTWQAEWTEEAFSDGNSLWKKHYRGIFETEIIPPSAMEEVLRNPLGIFIVDFNFSEIVTGGSR